MSIREKIIENVAKTMREETYTCDNDERIIIETLKESLNNCIIIDNVDFQSALQTAETLGLSNIETKALVSELIQSDIGSR